MNAQFGLVWFGNVLVVILINSGLARFKEYAKMAEKNIYQNAENLDFLTF